MDLIKKDNQSLSADCLLVGDWGGTLIRVLCPKSIAISDVKLKPNWGNFS